MGWWVTQTNGDERGGRKDGNPGSTPRGRVQEMEVKWAESLLQWSQSESGETGTKELGGLAALYNSLINLLWKAFCASQTQHGDLCVCTPQWEVFPHTRDYIIYLPHTVPRQPCAMKSQLSTLSTPVVFSRSVAEDEAKPYKFKRNPREKPDCGEQPPPPPCPSPTCRVPPALCCSTHWSGGWREETPRANGHKQSGLAFQMGSKELFETWSRKLGWGGGGRGGED